MATPCILLVEGPDDQHTVLALAQHHNLPEVFVVKALDGIQPLLESLPQQLKASDLERLGILVDADTDLAARWQALRDILVNAGYKVPKQPGAQGTVLSPDDLPRVGIWLMPDNQLPGMLEDFIAALAPEDDTLLPYARECVQKLPEQRFPEVLRAKANIHTWLAWQEEPGKPFGTAITAHYLDPQSARAQSFVNWLQALFVD